MSSEGLGIRISVHEAEITGAVERKLNRRSRSTHFFVKLTDLRAWTPKSNQRDSSGSPATAGVFQGASPRKSATTSDSDGGASTKPHQENWRVIGGGVMLGTPTS